MRLIRYRGAGFFRRRYRETVNSPILSRELHNADRASAREARVLKRTFRALDLISLSRKETPPGSAPYNFLNLLSVIWRYTGRNSYLFNRVRWLVLRPTTVVIVAGFLGVISLRVPLFNVL